jgi:drug/metabolite transporter (DMT)-like permease
VRTPPVQSAGKGAIIAGTAFVLVLAAALLHSSWNLLVKASNDRLVAGWAQVFFGALVFLPFLLTVGIPWSAWPYFVVSGFIHVAYSLSLVTAYERADLSVVYPIARGAAPLFITAVAFAFLDDRPGVVGLGAILLLTTGVLIIGLRRGERGSWWALLTAAFIATYTSIDGAAVRSLGESFAYTITVFVTGALLFTPIIVWSHGWARLGTAVRRERWRYVFAGIASAGAYGLVLIAARSAPLGLVAAVRETSVVFGALGGWLILKEPLGARRLRAAALIAAGLVLLAFAG